MVALFKNALKAYRLPGKSGKIEVKFNSKGKKNKQTKKVTVTANTDPGKLFLTINAQVTPTPVKEVICRRVF